MESNNQTDKPEELHKGLRKKIKVFYGFWFVLSVLWAPLSVFVADGSSSPDARMWIVLSSWVLPLTILLPMFLSKKSLWWFLLPLVPLIVFTISSRILAKDMKGDYQDYCEQAINRQENLAHLKQYENIDCYRYAQ